SAVRRALAKRPDERFSTAAAFADALLGQPERAGSMYTTAGAPRLGVPNDEPSRRVVRARVAVYAALGGIAVGLIGGWGLASASSGVTSNGPPRPSWRPPSSAVKLSADDAGEAIAMRRGSSNDGLSLVILNRAGKVQRQVAANRPWTPRFSPDGRNVAYGAFGSGRSTSDIWVTDLDAGTTRRLTDDDGDSNDPQWSPDGTAVAYSVNAPGGKDVAEQRLATGATRVAATLNGTQFPSDWTRNGNALILIDDSRGPHEILMQPADGSAATTYASTTADERAARVSPDGHWIAYISDESGRGEVYVDSYPRPGRRVAVSHGGGIDPVWRGDGRELYYWRGDALVAVQMDLARADGPGIGAISELFRAPYQSALNSMYDASADGSRFVIVEHR
ncbi:MAG TPA: hypothetical protein VFD67_11840, partial [Gemmatimonadaceae bacterium]|nr:hypothetical protein [Gemmatimonadaceae bacterium]